MPDSYERTTVTNEPETVVVRRGGGSAGWWMAAVVAVVAIVAVAFMYMNAGGPSESELQAARDRGVADANLAAASASAQQAASVAAQAAQDAAAGAARATESAAQSAATATESAVDAAQAIGAGGAAGDLPDHVSWRRPARAHDLMMPASWPNGRPGDADIMGQ